MVRLPIAALANPLEGKFDLSQCGNSGQHLSIATGYRKDTEPRKLYKTEIWLDLRFLIGKEINASARHFQPIFGGWNERNQVGIFWRWGRWKNLTWYDYLTDQTMRELGNGDLYKKWEKSITAPIVRMGVVGSGYGVKFSFSFCDVRDG
jgi:hypothetical protein